MSVINLISLTQKYESETPFAIAKHSTIGCGGSGGVLSPNGGRNGTAYLRASTLANSLLRSGEYE